MIHAFTASANPIAFGDTATLSWSVDDAVSVTLDQGIGAPTGMTVDVSPTSTTYTLTAHGVSHDVIAQLTVKVTPRIASFTASPSPIDPGQTSTLFFDVRGSPAGTWSIDQGIGTVSGLTQVTTGPLSQSRTYVLTATNPAGTVTATTTAHVNIQITVAPASPPVLLPEQTVQFAATLVGNTNPAVTWSLQEGPVAGLIDASGFYTAGWTSGTYHVVATSLADPTYSASAAVTVNRPASGTLDVTFGDGGVVFGASGTLADAVTVINRDIYYAATLTDGGPSRMYLGKLNPDGQPDPAFTEVLGTSATKMSIAVDPSNQTSNLWIGGLNSSDTEVAELRTTTGAIQNVGSQTYLTGPTVFGNGCLISGTSAEPALANGFHVLLGGTGFAANGNGYLDLAIGDKTTFPTYRTPAPAVAPTNKPSLVACTSVSPVGTAERVFVMHAAQTYLLYGGTPLFASCRNSSAVSFFAKHIAGGDSMVMVTGTDSSHPCIGFAANSCNTTLPNRLSSSCFAQWPSYNTANGGVFTAPTEALVLMNGNNITQFGVAKVDTAGNPSLGFGNFGLVDIDLQRSGTSAKSVVLQPSGSVAGSVPKPVISGVSGGRAFVLRLWP